MSAVFTVMLSVLGGMMRALLAERFLKFAIIKGLEILVKKTETSADDELLKKAKEEWAKS